MERPLGLRCLLPFSCISYLANDYGDSRNGADNAERVGPQRAVQSGAISAGQMRLAVIITSALAFISGILLIGAGVGFSASVTWFVFLLLGIGAVAAAISYTVGKKPYGYMGFGDLFVFLFFGLTGVLVKLFPAFRTSEIRFVAPGISHGIFERSRAEPQQYARYQRRQPGG